MPAESIETIVDRQVRSWNAQRRVADLEPADRVHGPVVAFSREYGALGAEIARTVAARLEFEYYDRELVDRIAATARVRENVVESVDERVRDRISEWVTKQFGGDRMTGDDYMKDLSRVVLSLAHHGRAVIVGRGAHFLLAPAWTLRVRAFAAMDVRVARVAETHVLPPADARARVIRMDQERAEFALRHFGRDIGDPAAFDLLFDTGTLPAAACADITVAAFKGKFGAMRAGAR
ncbi:MAG: cytidylate kinase-like family protein [Deltaproteobacteria bacterium]|nr:cytidylate kinase-like family protein [Deltaproteobacteria bacterium]